LLEICKEQLCLIARLDPVLFIGDLILFGIYKRTIMLDYTTLFSSLRSKES